MGGPRLTSPGQGSQADQEALLISGGQHPAAWVYLQGSPLLSAPQEPSRRGPMRKALECPHLSVSKPGLFKKISNLFIYL